MERPRVLLLGFHSKSCNRRRLRVSGTARFVNIRLHMLPKTHRTPINCSSQPDLRRLISQGDRTHAAERLSIRFRPEPQIGATDRSQPDGLADRLGIAKCTEQHWVVKFPQSPGWLPHSVLRLQCLRDSAGRPWQNCQILLCRARLTGARPSALFAACGSAHTWRVALARSGKMTCKDRLGAAPAGWSKCRRIATCWACCRLVRSRLPASER